MLEGHMCHRQRFLELQWDMRPHPSLAGTHRPMREARRNPPNSTFSEFRLSLTLLSDPVAKMILKGKTKEFEWSRRATLHSVFLGARWLWGSVYLQLSLSTAFSPQVPLRRGSRRREPTSFKPESVAKRIPIALPRRGGLRAQEWSPWAGSRDRPWNSRVTAAATVFCCLLSFSMIPSRHHAYPRASMSPPASGIRSRPPVSWPCTRKPLLQAWHKLTDQQIFLRYQTEVSFHFLFTVAASCFYLISVSLVEVINMAPGVDHRCTAALLNGAVLLSATSWSTQMIHIQFQQLISQDTCPFPWPEGH